MKKVLSLLLALALSAAAFSLCVSAGEPTITVTRAEASDSFDYGFEVDYVLDGLQNDSVDGDAWIGIYPVTLIEEVKAGTNEFRGHSYGSWCSVSYDFHGESQTEDHIEKSHTDGAWGDSFVINEGASNPAIYGGALDTETEYQAVLFACDEAGYDVVAYSNVFTFRAPAEEPETAIAETYIADTKAPETAAPETKATETAASATETVSSTDAAETAETGKIGKKGCGSSVAGAAMLLALISAPVFLRKKH